MPRNHRSEDPVPLQSLPETILEILHFLDGRIFFEAIAIGKASSKGHALARRNPVVEHSSITIPDLRDVSNWLDLQNVSSNGSGKIILFVHIVAHPGYNAKEENLVSLEKVIAGEDSMGCRLFRAMQEVRHPVPSS